MAKPPVSVLTHLDNQNDDPRQARAQIEAIGVNGNTMRNAAGDMFEADAGAGLALDAGSLKVAITPTSAVRIDLGRRA